MSVVIVGGNDRMIRQYKDICESFQCHAKVFTQMHDGLKSKIGNPDLMVLFTNTVSHKMVKTAMEETRGGRTEIVRCHTSSQAALRGILEERICG